MIYIIISLLLVKYSTIRQFLSVNALRAVPGHVQCVSKRSHLAGQTVRAPRGARTVWPARLYTSRVGGVRREAYAEALHSMCALAHNFDYSIREVAGTGGGALPPPRSICMRSRVSYTVCILPSTCCRGGPV